MIAEMNSIRASSEAAVIGTCRADISVAQGNTGIALSDDSVDAYCRCVSMHSPAADCPLPVKQNVLPAMGTPASSVGARLFQILGSTGAIALGIASFVSGLLGWLLTMKKRVLECSGCSATINSS